jgi:hypothetical protein
MGILPARPLLLAENVLSARRRKALLLSAVFIVFGCAAGAGTAWFARQAWRERVVWSRGAEGRLLKLGGKVETTSKLGIDFFYDYRLDLVYADASGVSRPAKVEFETVWKPIDTSAPASIRYLSEDPEHPVLSWPIQAGGFRWGLPLLLAAIALLFGCAAVATPRVQARAEAALRDAAQDGEEILYPLLSASSYKGNWTIRYETSPGVKATASGRDAPLIVEREGRQHVVALRSPRATSPVLVPADLAVFAFDLTTRQAILERIRA